MRSSGPTSSRGPGGRANTTPPGGAAACSAQDRTPERNTRTQQASQHNTRTDAAHTRCTERPEGCTVRSVYIRSLRMPSRPTLVVLGAGATRGASFVRDEGHLHLPPLDADFFKLLSRSPAGRSQQARALIQYVQKNHSPTLDASMEAIFIELEGSAQFYKEFNISRGRIVREPQRTIDHFYRVLPAVMRHSIAAECDFHQTLVSALESGDAVISFNYDCLIDQAMKTNGGRRWHPEDGYGFEVATGADSWQHWGSGPDAKKPIKLLKLHGSLNWDRHGDAMHLLDTPYERDSAAGAVVPPPRSKAGFGRAVLTRLACSPGGRKARRAPDRYWVQPPRR